MIKPYAKLKPYTPPKFRKPAPYKMPKPHLPAKLGPVAGAPAPVAPAAPAASAAPAAPTLPPVGTPNDARYNSDINAAQTAYNNQNLALQGQETDVRSSFGFDPQYANNPYTQAALLQRAHDQQFANTTNVLAARGQMYSGHMNRQRAADEFAAGQRLDTVKRNYSGALNKIAQARLSNQSRFDQARSSAYADLLDRIAASQTDSSLYDPGPTNDYPDVGGPAGTAKRKRKRKK